MGPETVWCSQCQQSVITTTHLLVHGTEYRAMAHSLQMHNGVREWCKGSCRVVALDKTRKNKRKEDQ